MSRRVRPLLRLVPVRPDRTCPSAASGRVAGQPGSATFILPLLSGGSAVFVPLAVHRYAHGEDQGRGGA
ncbi:MULTISPECIES: hypothetical protein [unclassified Streptomyces]|uniref:hypothetical protein n=1 Tax=unclassified Streptomyces TaxID=2593676 RepID=UPI003243C51A